MQHRIGLSLATFIVLGLVAHVPDVRITNLLLARGRTEPVVAVSPAHPSNIFIGSNTNYSAPVGDTYPTAYFASNNGGRTFRAGNVPVLRPYTTGADPSVGINRFGTVYFVYLGETPSYCSGGRSAVLLTRSTDGGRTFRAPTVIDADPADDKPNLALQDSPGRPTRLFITWTRWHDRENSSDIWFSRSLDAGATFGRPAELYSSRADNFGSVPVAGPHGRVYVFWSTFPEGSMSAPTRTEIMLRASVDLGDHFGAPRSAVGTFWSVPRMAAPGSLRNLTMPAVSMSSGGTMYLSWATARRQYPSGSVDADIVVSRSVDGGRSWTKGRAVNDRHNGDRFMPALTAMSSDSVGIAFYDRRNSPWNLDTYAARVSFRHGFTVSRNVHVNRDSAPIGDIYYIRPGSTCFSPGRFFGDYIGVAATPHDSLAVVWTDTQLHVYQETDLWYADISLPGAGPK